ncbi:MAG TPA: hypothetical protein VG225_05865 [Terracidiphilus sp.]|jgi:hypothetical protein|nr:hypothetical protein [Terracidiphilus sp.]
MTPKVVPFILCAIVCHLGTSVSAQDKALRDRLFVARGQYYTPTASGLKSFHCEAAIDWKAMLSRLSGTDIPDDNPILKYLQTVHLSVADELRGQGSLEWTTNAVPPEGKEEAIRQMQEGFHTMMTGFFQTWNAYMNGSMVPIPDHSLTVTAAGEGIHISGTYNGGTIDEDFDKDTLLTQVLVVNPTLKVLAKPSYATTPDGLLISSVDSQISQPPSAPQTEAIFRIDYAKVDSFQIPSHIIFDIKNTGIVEIGLSACQVSVVDWAKKK